MKEYDIDCRLADIWNTANDYEKIMPEHMWELCRELSELDVLQHDTGAVSAFKIGPFKIVTDLTPTREDTLGFFVESFFPMLITHFASSITFQDAYPLYIVPAFKILIHMLSNCYCIKEDAVWIALIYIKTENETGIYPTENNLTRYFVENNINANAKEIISKCCTTKNFAGDKKQIIEIDNNGGIHSLV